MGLSVSCTLSFAQKTDTIKVFYDIDSYILDNKFKDEINKHLTDEISEIKIYSYTDFLGTKNHNLYLSQKRADNIKKYLLINGVSKDVVTTYKGMGCYLNSSAEDRTDENDRGVLKHRVSNIIFTYTPDNKTISKTEKETDPQKEEEQVEIPIFKNLTPENMEVGENIVLENILFHGGTPYFKKESASALNQLFLVMKNNPTLEIQIEGHICCEINGDDGWDRVNKNNYLSENRAKAVFDFLVEKGIEEKRMSYIGYGSKFKLYPEEKNFYEEDHNRRVEIKIVNK